MNDNPDGADCALCRADLEMVRSVERARCIKVLEDLLEDSWITEKRTAFRQAIAALSSPVQEQPQ